MFAIPLTPRKKRRDGQGDLYWDRIRWPAKEEEKTNPDKEKSIAEAPTAEEASENLKSQGTKTRLSAKDLYRLVGPGVVTGAADNDPSGIATYSQAGAQFGLGMLWLALFQFPLITAVQEACARIGIVTGSGLGAIIGKKYNRKVAVPLASLLLIANTINIGADIGAMSASVRLIVPEVPLVLATIGFTALIIVAEIAVPYKKYVKGLKYLTISLFAYILTSIIVGGNWERLFVATFVPHVELSPQYAMMFVAMFGTTISPYLFYWQTSEEAEEQVAEGKIKEIGKGKPKVGKKQVMLMKLDVTIGMIFSQVIAWFIITTAAGSLHAHGITRKDFSIQWSYGKNHFCIWDNRDWSPCGTCLGWLLWIRVGRRIWLETGSGQKVQTGQGILPCNCGSYFGGTLDKLYKHRSNQGSGIYCSH
jgi:hypothetical protein